MYGYVGNDPLYWVDPTGLFWAQIGAGVGGVIGGGGAFIGSLFGDAGTFGGNLLLTPAEVGAGITGGALIGGGLGALLDGLGGSMQPQGPTVCHARPGAGSDMPSKGPPNSTDVSDRGNGNGTIRDYGPNGDAQTDYDFGHDHGSGDPHGHDWNNGVRGPHRPLAPGE